MREHTWVFGYGSLIWRPDFEFVERRVATLNGYSRRFWQGSHDHRGIPERPGRVVTLVPDASARCIGMAYRINATVLTEVFENLDHREKNGYDRRQVTLTLEDGIAIDSILYLAPRGNFAYLGEAPLTEVAQQIASSEGPSGRNDAYLFELAQALRELHSTDDEHVFQLERLVLEITQHQTSNGA